jgi:hypothetical protein
VSRDEYFFEVPKGQIKTFCMSADGFYNIGLPFCGENLKSNFCFRQLSGYESRHISKIQNGRRKQRELGAGLRFFPINRSGSGEVFSACTFP